MPQILSSGKRKYHNIMHRLTSLNDEHGKPFAIVDLHRCEIKCSRQDTTTIINGVKKEKVIWTKKGKAPKDKVLEVEVTDEGIIFKLVTDTSIRNL